MMLKKFLLTSSIVGLIAGSANALEVEPFAAGADLAGEPVLIAEELDFAGGAVSSTIVGNEVRVAFFPSGGTFPTGNVLLRAQVTGGTFDGALTGAEVTTAGTSVISSDGADGGTAVTFLLSDVSTCAGPVATANCTVSLPLELDGNDVTIALGLQTDAGAPIDNSSNTSLVSTQVVDVATAWDISFAPDTGDTTATLASLFTALDVAGDADLGDVIVGVNAVDFGGGDRTVNRDLAGNDVDGTDVLDTEIIVSGFMDAYDPVVAPAGGSFDIGAAGGETVDSAADTATEEFLAAAGLATFAVGITPDTTSAIQRSSYSATVTVTPAVASPLTAGATATGSLQSVDRDGTQVVFPWTQSQTQGAVSGTTSVFRIGNLDTTAAGAVFVEVKNSSDSAYVNPGIVQVDTSIPASGEITVNSSDLEGLVGDYSRGDIEFTVEAQPGTLTGRQFVVRNGNIQQVSGGNLSEDLN